LGRIRLKEVGRGVRNREKGRRQKTEITIVKESMDKNKRKREIERERG
jgi:hypothetical protein